MLKKWEDLPQFMQCDEVREYYECLVKRKKSLMFKRAFDVVVSIILLIILAVPMVVIAAIIKIDSEGPVLYRQERITAYGKKFRIHKFRTMESNADKIGTAVTVKDDNRITNVGAKLRKNRLDEIPQLIDVLKGDMSFVGTRPEVPKYVEKYSKEMRAVLLLPAGITSETSIRYKDEEQLLDNVEDIDKVYIEEILPVKMQHNLDNIKKFSFWRDIVTMLRTVFAVLVKEYT